MSIVERAALATVVNASPSDDLVLRLFTNNREPSDGDSAGQYREASGGGYTAKRLRGADWVIISRDGLAQATHAMLTFPFSGAVGTVYGFYLTKERSGALVHAERFAAPVNIANNGDVITVTPRLRGITREE